MKTNALSIRASAFQGKELLPLLQAYQKLKPEEAVAYFQTSTPTETGFAPSLTVLGLKPLEIIQSQNGITRIRKNGEVSTSKENPFQVIEARIDAQKREYLPNLPFFQGGALGYLSYDAVRFLESSLASEKKRATDTQYDAEVVIFQFYLLVDHAKNESFLLNFGDESEGASFERSLQSFFKDKAPEAQVARKSSPPLPVEKMQFILGKDAFLKGVLRLKEHILEGDIFQAVLSERFSVPFTGNSLRLFETLSQISPAPYQFYFSIEGRAYLGASPEMLLKSERGQIETHPIAGTRPRGKTPAEEKAQEADLLADIKERAEHLMLVDLSRNDIGRVSTPGSVKVESFMKVRRFGGVMHLVSIVKGQKKNEVSSLSSLASCFPAGTLSGAPKIRAMQLLNEIEPEPRGFYGGAFIAASFTGDLDSCISIRSISVQDGRASIQVGAGIVADSVPENEYAEILHKSTLTRTAIAMELGL